MHQERRYISDNRIDLIKVFLYIYIYIYIYLYIYLYIFIYIYIVVEKEKKKSIMSKKTVDKENLVSLSKKKPYACHIKLDPRIKLFSPK